jgi:chromosomal replication initiator protein
LNGSRKREIMTSFTILWESTLKELEDFYSQNNDRLGFDNYIKTLIPEFFDNGMLYLKAPMELQKELVNQRFLVKITEALNLAHFKLTGRSESLSASVYSPKDANSIMTLHSASGRASESNPYNISLNPNYTFDSFVVGNSNKLANAASRAVADSPGEAYNPLFIYGGVGLGKTHLMHAIANQILKKNPYVKIIYITSESFTNEFIEAIRNKSNERFRNKFRKADVLLIDDIQFISKGPGTQEELFHTFNTLYDQRKQIILSSDKLPSDIPNLEERLLSRFHWGLLADVAPPDYETRVAILKNKAPLILDMTGCNFLIEEDVMQHIASKENSNIRDLEGALRKVIAYAKLYTLENSVYSIDMELAADALKDFFTEKTVKSITPKLIIKNVSNYYDISEEEILGEKKNREIAFPRQVAMYLLRSLTDLPYLKIGELLGGRHYSTVIHAEDKVLGLMKTSPETKNAINDIIVRIKE